MHVNAQFHIIARVHPHPAVIATVTTATSRTVAHAPGHVTEAAPGADVTTGADHAVVMAVTIDSRTMNQILKMHMVNKL